MTVAGIAANAGTLPCVLFVDADAQRHVKWLQPCPFEIVVQVLYALFMADGGILIRGTGPGLGWILTAVAVYLVQMLGLRVIGFEFLIADGPGGGNSAVMSNFTEIFFAQAKESSTVELRVTADEIVGVRMQVLPFTVAPGLFGVVFPFEINGACTPVVLLRSEEHTSELQSLAYLVCRLLLEKKNK